MEQESRKLARPQPAYKESASETDDIDNILAGNNARRSGMRFSTIEEFLASLNTATTSVVALHGLQNISVESYKKCMEGVKPEESAGDGAMQMMKPNTSAIIEQQRSLDDMGN